MALMFRFVADRKYLIDGVAYTYVEADDAERNDPGSGRENSYYFRNDLTRAQDRFLQSELKEKRDRITERGASTKIGQPSRPVDLKPSERRIETILRDYDASPFPLRAKKIEKFLIGVSRSHPDIKIPSHRQFKDWVKKRGETGRRSARDFRDGRGRHSKRHFQDKVAWALSMVVIWFYSARHRTRAAAVGRLAKFVRTLRARTLRFEGEDRARAIKMPSRTAVYDAIAKARTAALTEAKTSNREATKERGVRVTLPDIEKHLDVVAIDSTTADDWIVFVPELLILLRRPVISLAVDAWSGCITAIVVTWRKDLEAVFSTLKTSIRSKSTLVAGRPHLDPANVFGLSQCYLIDNALEQTGKSFQDGLDDAGSSVHWAPKANPEYKAIVERPIGALNTQCLHLLPNAIPYSATALRRIGYDPKTDGKPILIETLQEHLLDFMARYNEAIRPGEFRSRKLLWDLSVELHGFDTFGDVDLLDDAFGEVVTVTITRSGVKWGGLRFHAPDIITALLDSMGGTDPPDDFQVTRRGRRGARKSLTVTTKAKIRRSDLRFISVFDYVRGCYVKLPCTLKLPQLISLDHAFITAYKEFAQTQQLSFRTDEDICVAGAEYHRRLENSDMTRRIKASRVSSELGRGIGPMPGGTGVLRAIGEPGPLAMRPTGEIVIEAMAPKRGDAFRPDVGPKRGGKRKGTSSRSRSLQQTEQGVAGERVQTASTKTRTPPSPKRDVRPRQTKVETPKAPMRAVGAESQLDPTTLLLLSLK